MFMLEGRRKQTARGLDVSQKQTKAVIQVRNDRKTAGIDVMII